VGNSRIALPLAAARQRPAMETGSLASTDKPKEGRCCGRMCCCFTFCLLPILFVAGLVFWPRPITICVQYADIGLQGPGQVGQLPSVTVPLEIENTNWWGLKISVELSSYLRGSEQGRGVLLGTSEARDLKLEALRTTESLVALRAASPSEQSSSEVAQATMRLFDDCGAQLNRLDGTWTTDMHMIVGVFGIELPLWFQVNVPCLPGQSVPDQCGLTDCGTEDASNSDQLGEVCFRVLCSPTDLTCEKEQCMQEAYRGGALADFRATLKEQIDSGTC